MKREHTIVFFFFLLITAVFFYPIFQGFIPFPGDLLVGNYAPYNTNEYEGFLKGGVPHKGQGVDVVRQLFPWKHFAISQLKDGNMPLWNPYNLSGNPLLANFQSGVFYPLNAVFFLTDFVSAWTFYIFVIPLLSALFLYLYLRDIELERFASAFGALVFAFSSYIVVWLEWGNVGHTFLWLPLALFFTHRLLSQPSRKYMLLLTAVFSISLLAGYIQGFFYLMVMCICYFFINARSRHALQRKQVMFFLSAVGLAFLLTLFQTLPTIELFLHSARGNYSLDQITKLLNPAWYTITTIVPNYFGHPAARNHWFYGTYIERVSYFGFLPFFFALYAVLCIKVKKEILFFGIVFFLSLFLSLDLFVTRYVYTLPLPILSTTVPTRILSLFVFSGSILAAFGICYFLQRFTLKKTAGILFFLGLLLTGAYLSTFVFGQGAQENINSSVSRKNLILPLGFFLSIFFLSAFYFFAKKSKSIGQQFVQKTLISMIFLLTILDLFYFFHKITPFSPKSFIFPKTDVVSFLKNQSGVDRYWGYGTAYMDTNFQTYEMLFSPDGYEPLHSARYNALLASSKDGTIPEEVTRSDANLATGYGNEDLRENQYRQRLLNLLGVEYVLHKTDAKTPDYLTFPEDRYAFLWQQDEWQVYKNLQVLPRSFLSFSTRVIQSDEELLQAIYDERTDLRNTILLEEPVPFRATTNATGAATILSYTPNNVTVATDANAEAWLFLSDTHFPGWTAQIDGENAKIYRADFAFRAVKVSPGQHTVVFAYKPLSFTIGLAVSIAALMIVILSVLGSRLKKLYA